MYQIDFTTLMQQAESLCPAYYMSGLWMVLVAVMLVLCVLAFVLRWWAYLLPDKLSDIAWERTVRSGKNELDPSIDNSQWHIKENGVSIIIPVHNEAENLREHLPIILEQDYDNYEVIVVDDASDDETSYLLNQLKYKYPHLRPITIPHGLQHTRRLRLSISLGVKSATKEWILLTQSDCFPESKQWIQAFSTFFNKERQLIQGYVNYADMKSGNMQRKRRMRMNHFLSMAQDSRRGTPVGADICNLCLRKQTFLERSIFSQHLADDADEGTIVAEAFNDLKPEQYALSFAPEITVRQTLNYEGYIKHDLHRKSVAISWRGKWKRMRRICYYATKGLFLLTSLIYIVLFALSWQHLMVTEAEQIVLMLVLPILMGVLFIVTPYLLYRSGTQSHL